jgi:hypothetical protein
MEKIRDPETHDYFTYVGLTLALAAIVIALHYAGYLSAGEQWLNTTLGNLR